jgi:hypothetical protein
MSRTKVRGAWKGTTKQTRLNIFDGLYPGADERGVTHRINGQKLRDIIDPSTGFVVNSVTPCFNPLDPPVRAAAGVSGGGAVMPERDADTGAWHDPQTGHVYRLTTDGDGALSRTRVVKTATSARDHDAPTTEKIRRTRPSGEPRQSSGKPKSGASSISNEEIAAYCAEKFGYRGPLSKRIREAARAAITKHRTVLAYQADMR